MPTPAIAKLQEKIQAMFAPKSDASTNSPAQPKNVKNRWLLVAGAAGVGIIILAGMASEEPQQRTTRAQKDEAERMVDVTPKELDRRSWQAQSMVEMERMRRDVDAVKRENEKLQADLEKVRAAAEAAAARAAEAPGGAGLPSGVTPPPVPRDRAGQVIRQQPGTQQPTPGAQTPGAPSVPGQAPGPGAQAPSTEPPPVAAVPSVVATPLVSRPAPAPQSAQEAEKKAAAEAEKAESQKARVQVKESPYAGMLPPGAFAEVALLHGLDAATGSVAMSNPQPVLLNVQNHATLPGSARYQLKSCFVLGSAWGDLSAERLYVQLVRLSCVDKDNKLMLSTAIDGYLVDSDGILGMRGVVSDRQGAKLAKSMLASFAEGLASALKMSQGSVSTSPLGSVSSVTGAEAVRGAGLQGAASGAQQLSQFYLKEAAQMFPVLTVQGGRLATIVIQSGAKLQWGPQDVIYETQVKPTN